MKGTIPVIMCDNEYGCDSWIIDNYTLGATNWQEFMDGWQYDPYDRMDEALCPECIKRAAEEAEEAKP